MRSEHRHSFASLTPATVAGWVSLFFCARLSRDCSHVDTSTPPSHPTRRTTTMILRRVTTALGLATTRQLRRSFATTNKPQPGPTVRVHATLNLPHANAHARVCACVGAPMARTKHHPRLTDWWGERQQAQFYKTFTRPVAKALLIAVLTYQLVYFGWTKLETDDIREKTDGGLPRPLSPSHSRDLAPGRGEKVMR